MTIEMHGGHFGSHPSDRFISTRRIGESEIISGISPKVFSSSDVVPAQEF